MSADQKIQSTIDYYYRGSPSDRFSRREARINESEAMYGALGDRLLRSLQERLRMAGVATLTHNQTDWNYHTCFSFEFFIGIDPQHQNLFEEQSKASYMAILQASAEPIYCVSLDISILHPFYDMLFTTREIQGSKILSRWYLAPPADICENAAAPLIAWLTEMGFIKADVNLLKTPVPDVALELAESTQMYHCLFRDSYAQFCEDACGQNIW